MVGENAVAQQEPAVTDHHDEQESSVTFRDSVSSSALGLHELHELRESQQLYEQAWWDYGLNLCGASWHDPLALVSFAVPAPLLNIQLRFEVCRWALDSANPPLFKLWNYGLKCNLPQKDKDLLRNDEEC